VHAACPDFSSIFIRKSLFNKKFPLEFEIVTDALFAVIETLLIA
jgi:hypothetical protein